MTRTLEIVKQASVFVEKDGKRLLAWWLQHRIDGKTRSLVMVLKPALLVLPRDDIGVGFADAAHDLTFKQMQTWLVERGYRLLGPIVQPE